MDLEVAFLDQLYDRTTDENYDKNTRFNVTYSLLKGLSGKPYFKIMYKTLFVKSN